jgi:acyl carrier protein
MKSIPPESGIRILEQLAEGGDIQAVVWPPDWEHWARTYPTFARTSLFAHLLGPAPRAAEPARSTVHTALGDVPDGEREQALRDLVVREVAAQLRIAVEDLPLDATLERLGFDSLQATELQARFIDDLAVRIPILRLLGFATVSTITDEVLAAVRDSGTRLVAATEIPPPAEFLSDHDALFKRSG